MSIRERVAEFDALTKAHPDEQYLCMGVTADRSALLAAGDALAQMLQMQHPVEAMHGLGNEVIGAWCNGCDANEKECWAVPAIAAWEAVAG